MATLQLWVDNEDSAGTWSTAGSPPYLSSQDQPSNYIYSTSRNANSGIYSFQTTGQTGTINSVYLYIYAYGVASSNFTTYVNASNTGLGPPTSWGWVNVDVSSILTSWALINSATMYFDRPNTDNDAGVDAAYLYIDYEADTTLSVNRSDSITVGESSPLGPLSIFGLVSDSVNVSDSPDIDSVLINTIATDSVNISESANIDPILLSGYAFDSVGLNDVPLLNLLTMVINVLDQSNINENVDVNVQVPEGPALTISVTFDDYEYWVQGVKITG